MTHAQETIGERIAKYRKRGGLSAEKLAERANLTRSVITNIETGRREDASWREIESIANALGVAPLALVLPIDRPFDPTDFDGWTTTNYGVRSAYIGESSMPRESDVGNDVTTLIAQTDNLIALREEIRFLVDQICDIAGGAHAAHSMISGALAPPDPARDAVEQHRRVSRSYKSILTAFVELGGKAPHDDPTTSTLEARGLRVNANT
ncbi:helix-turn-helix domain-containing protein [Microbacterium sp. C7(2022)]|uniref:helix-turn-helix domain-containing protein n=1 Tax=Microbacterium sp. C7(2022) TaxID=2992759 RepID=UPI00237A82FC|nr:helix-turn-helix transcriptional regulator [Microbacterium sp. C7(2022)]MDE0545438.1 helix-turn-helix domain-containing protein [Microbacterium sp. C7(2022)]